jgi:hypothetical protein
VAFSTITTNFARGPGRRFNSYQRTLCCIFRSRSWSVLKMYIITWITNPNILILFSHDFPEPLRMLHDVALEQQSKIEILYTVKHNIFTKTLINIQNVTKFIKQYFYNERKITYRGVNNHSTSSNPPFCLSSTCTSCNIFIHEVACIIN